MTFSLENLNRFDEPTPPGVTMTESHTYDVPTPYKSSREAHPLQGDREICLCSQTHHVRDPQQLAPPVSFLHLAIDQARSYLPLACFAPLVTHLEPLSKVGRQRIKVQVETITGEERETARGQELPQRMDDRMRHVLRAGTQMKDRNDLCQGVDGQPEPEDLLVAAQPGSQFIQLEVREPEMAEGALVQGLCVLASASHPGGDGGLPVAEDPLGSGRVQPFGKRSQHQSDVVRGGFQTIQGGVASGSERRVAGLAAKGLDPLGMAMRAIANQRMNVSVCDPGVRTLMVGAGEALGVHPFRCSPAAFDLAPRSDRKRRWLHNRREGGGEATGWTIEGGARLEKTLDRGAHLRCRSRVGRAMMGPGKMIKLCQREHEQEQEHEQEHMKVHTNPLCLK